MVRTIEIILEDTYNKHMTEEERTIKLNYKYLVASILIFLIEVVIALFVHDDFIRPYVGDVLVIILIYTVLKSVIKRSTKRLPAYIFIFAVMIEISQLFRLVELLGLQNSRVATIVLGSTFDIMDIVSYGIGALLLVGWEGALRKDISYL